MSWTRVGRISASCLIVCALAAAARAQARVVGPLSVAEYADWLKRVAGSVASSEEVPGQLAGFIRDTPSAWSVEAGQRTFDISNAWLIRDLRELQSKPESDARSRLIARLASLSAQAAAFEEPAADSTRSTVLLKDILNRREFRSIHGPTWLDRLRQQVLSWIIGLLGRVFGSSAIPTVSTVIVYGLIGLAVIALSVWTYQLLTRATVVDTVVPGRIPVSAKVWPIWLAEAQAAAAEGNWRNAIHLAYWCAVSFLEGRGAWRPDRARTPREYLRLLPPTSEERPSLAALTRSLELVWYGTHEADARAFADALATLEKIGCRPV